MTEVAAAVKPAKSLKGSQTEKNILTAFAGESQARNRYTYYAGTATKEGYRQIAAVFAETADQEKEHAKRLYKLLENGEVEVAAVFPAGKLGSTAANLADAAAGEKHECEAMYPEFAATATQEGYPEIAAIFRAILVAEKRHETRYEKLLANLQAGTVFKKPEKVRWVCRNCGYVHEGAAAPKTCPACLHEQEYFELDGMNF